MVQWGFSTLVWDQFTKLPPVLTTDLKGKSVLVVGANTGIGLEAAKHFARMNPARLILACRSEERANKAAEVIAKDTSYKSEIQLLDLASFESVVALAKRLEGDPIDIVVANAGVAMPEYTLTGDGWEPTLQVNHLSTALLSFLLVPNMLKAAELHASSSRLVIVSSETHFMTNFDEAMVQSGIVQKLNDKEYCTPKVMAQRYPASKLLNVLFTRAFTHHLSDAQSSSLITNTVNPGLCATDLARNASFAAWLRLKTMHLIMARTAEQGARQLVWAALGPDGKEGPHVQTTMQGAYVSIAEVRQPSDFVTSKEGWDAQESLWHETIDILTKVAPSVRGIIEQHFTN